MTGSPTPSARLIDARYVIGLDIGDGESALAWTSPDDHEPAQVYRRRRTGEKSILTSISYSRLEDDENQHGDGAPRTVFGEEAVLTDEAIHFSVSFKQPSRFGKVLEYGQALLAEFFEEHPGVAEKFLVFVGYPAGWPADVVALYRRHMELLDPSVVLLPESQSALVHVRDLSRARAEQLDNVLVIDIGSSTVDVTVVEDLIPRNIDTGMDLGCKQIDKHLASLVKEAFAGDPELARALRTSGGEDMLLLACRRAKEAQFSGRTQRVLDIRSVLNRNYEIITDRGFGALRAMEIPQEVTRPGGWADRFKWFLAAVKGDLKKPPEVVVLTGGGSRMPFVWQSCRDAFPDANLEPQRGTAVSEDASLSVAQGLASAGSQRVRVARFRRDVSAIVTSEETSVEIREQTNRAFTTIRDSLVEAVSHARGTPASLAENLPGREQAADQLRAAISAYLVPRAQRVCATYDIDSTKFGISLELPPLFAADVINRIANPASHDMSKETLGAAATRTAAAGVKGMWAWARGSPRPDAGWLAVAAVAGAMAGAVLAAEVGTNKYQRRRAIAELRRAQLPPEAAERIVADTLDAISALMDERASSVERFVT